MVHMKRKGDSYPASAPSDWNVNMREKISLCLHPFKGFHKEIPEIELVNIRMILRIAHFSADFEVCLHLRNAAI
jgi:hypothetical protein